jgi:hypothetical protein
MPDRDDARPYRYGIIGCSGIIRYGRAGRRGDTPPWLPTGFPRRLRVADIEPGSMKSRNVPEMCCFRDGGNGLRTCNPGRHGGLGQARGPAPTGMVSSVFPKRSDMDRPNVVGAGLHDGRMDGRDDAVTRTYAGHRGASP